MRALLTTLILLGTVVLPGPSVLPAQEKASPLPKAVAIKLEKFLLLPEPRAAKSGISQVLGGARLTVFNPVKEEAGPRLVPYTESEFAKMGISADSYIQRAGEAADRKLALIQPELMKDETGKVIYAVYRGPDPIYACLLTAPSLGRIFEKIFGKEIWVVTPDRNSLYVFPANAEALGDFTADLEERFESNPFATSEEVFSLKADGSEMKVIGNFTNR